MRHVGAKTTFPASVAQGPEWIARPATRPCGRAGLIVLMLAGCVLALVAPASALADSIAIGASTDPVEDVTYQIGVGGATSSFKNVYATIKATGGRPCGANPDADGGDTILSSEDAPGGQFGFINNRTTYDSGTYLLCAWVDDSSSDTPTAVAQQVITVRVPRSSASIAVPGQVARGATFQVAVTAQSEVFRQLFVDINSPGVPCAANQEANRGLTTVLSGQDNLGGPFTYTSNVTAPPDAPGVYSVCGYVQESSSDAAPEVTFGNRLTIGTPARVRSGTSVAFVSTPRSVRSRHRFSLTARVRSPQGTPTGTCVFYRVAGRRLLEVGRDHPGRARGTCSTRVKAGGAGRVQYTVRFLRTALWEQSQATSRRIRVRR